MSENLFLSLAVFLALTACTSSQYPIEGVQAVQTAINAQQPLTPPASFEQWKQQFTARAVRQGIQTQDVQRLIEAAQENPRIVSQDRKQPEFVKMPWEYVEGAVSSVRIKNGQTRFQENQPYLQTLAQRYGVPAEIITAIWGVETAYGENTGSASLADSLATLAYEGRRREFAEQQLLALLQLLERGDVPWQPLTGSWAGGMGQTQFIPATWLQYGTDGNGDGHRNPWDRADALASTANYLGSSGWVRGLPWGYEVRLPQGFDYRLIGEKLPLGQWQQMGVQPLAQAFAQPQATAELWLPAGYNGPALLLTKNFNVIKVYNNSSNYALGVALLADRIAGRSGLKTAWPRNEQPLAGAQVATLQQRLTSAGFDTKGTDGILGANTRSAFQQWQAANGQIPDGFISQRTAAPLLQ